MIGVGIQRLLFIGLGHLSNGDLSIAADFARQLPPDRFQVGFVTAAGTAGYVRGFGLTVHPLDAETPERNRELFERLMTEFRPDLLVAADAFTLDYSTGWSGLSMGLLRERYDVALASFDQYDYPAADYVVDFYTGHRTRFPRIFEACDLVIRNSPLNRPVPGDPGIAVARMVCGGSSPLRVTRPRRADVPTVFLANSRWEQVNVVRAPEMAELIRVMPRILHSHLAALRRPLRVVHVGPVRWEFPIADQIDYQHIGRLTPAEFHTQLTDADLFLTGNAVSVTLTQAVLAGVPSLLLQNYKTLDVAGLIRSGSAPAWLVAAASDLTVAYPYRVYPWGWYEFLAPVLSDNPYVDCFLTVGVFERRRVLAAINELLDDATLRSRLRDRQAELLHRLDRLPSAAEALDNAKLG